MTESAIQETVRSIRDFLLTAHTQLPLGLLEGKAGIMAFLAESAQLMPGASAIDQIDLYLQEINTKWQKGLRHHTLTAGTAGVLWGSSFVEEIFPDQFHSDPYKKGKIDLVKHQLSLFLQRDNLDYLHGATGIIKVLASQNLLTKPEIDSVFDHFRKHAVPTPNGISWETTFYFNKPTIHPGLAHGSAGIINMLGGLEGLSNPEVNEHLIRPSILDLYSRFLAEVNGIKGDQFTCATHYHSWCTSYLGTSLVLLKYLRQFEYEAEYVRVKNKVSKQLKMLKDFSVINDPCVCHGSAGMMIMLGQLLSHDENTEIEQLQQNLVEKTITILFDAGSIKKENLKPAFTQDLSLLTGLSGIGLALLHKLKPNPFLLKVLNID